jgi:hypothetical protein
MYLRRRKLLVNRTSGLKNQARVLHLLLYLFAIVELKQLLTERL